MRVLLVKLSSLGDVVHTWPALSDAARACPDVSFDWLVEEPFAGLASLHPAVARIIPVRLRAAKRQGGGAVLAHLRALRSELKGNYDLVIDAQGLMKSALVSRLAGAPVAGFSRQHAREPLAAFAYRTTFDLTVQQHAVERSRKLLAGALGYDHAEFALENDLDVEALAGQGRRMLAEIGITYPPLAVLHGSAWSSKTWPVASWTRLVLHNARTDLPIVVPSGSPAERRAAEQMCAVSDHAHVLPEFSLPELAAVLACCRAAVGVDSGLTHLAVALKRPGAMLMGPTDPMRTGPASDIMNTIVSAHPSAPCYNRTCAHGMPGEGCMAVIKVDTVSKSLASVVSKSGEIRT